MGKEKKVPLELMTPMALKASRRHSKKILIYNDMLRRGTDDLSDESIVEEKKIRYNEVFDELLRRGFITKPSTDGKEELMKKVSYDIPVKEKTLETLLPEERKIISFYYGFEGNERNNFYEIASKLKLTPADIEMSLYQAIKKLRQGHRKWFNDAVY